MLFYNYTKLTEVEFPTTLTHIGSSAFFNTRIVHLSIPGNVTTIENGAFSWNEALETLTLHEGIQTLGTGVFQLCNKLQSVVIPNSITTMGRQCFSQCTSLSSVTLPQGIQVLEESLFSDCPIPQLTIPNSVTQIKHHALGKHLSQIIIPASVTHLGNLNSTVLTTLILKGSTPPDLAGNNYFFYSLPNLRHIYVPAGSVATYQNAEIWKNKMHLIEAEP
ncbi:leucine-rich repeat domain-containing protein [Capnocytophaga canimorsus]|nr:leucine-rich repeat domain-containing protein [Capnocytophaga canimorsus]WGU69414.1 leucine-rich repeat domain-containing protein [Capnocytophaga canimorsus]